MISTATRSMLDTHATDSKQFTDIHKNSFHEEDFTAGTMYSKRELLNEYVSTSVSADSHDHMIVDAS